MKKNINFFIAFRMAIALLKKYECGVVECCHYCGSVLIKKVDGVDNGDEYRSNHKCMNCGATAKIREIWRNGSVKEYIGVKIVQAKPMTKGEYNKFRGWIIPENENPDNMGYLVKYSDDYISWSPENAFNEAYRETSEMTFGLAIEVLKKGFKVARKGWNGKGIFIELQRPDVNSKMTHPYIYIDTTGLQTDNPDAPKNCVPWLASQTDMLAEDWIILS